MTRFSLACAFAAIALLIGAARAAALPTILTGRTATDDISQRLQERPPTISYTEANERQIAGSYNGFAPGGGPDFGPLTWTVYTEAEARAAGIAFVTDCSALTCDEEAASKPFPATVRAFAPQHGRFTRLTITYTYHGRTVIEHDHLNHYPADDEGSRSHWGYAVDLPPKYKRCGTVQLNRRQADRPRRAVVRTNPEDASCATALQVARKATTRVAEVGNPLPAPRGWQCMGGFRPSVIDPRPSLIGCYRTGAASVFEQSFNPFYQVAVR
jgi:hypothetical protein